MKRASARDLAIVIVPVALLLAFGAWLVARFVQPAPPKVVVMSTGAPDGAYQAFAKRYQAFLADYGIRLELRPSEGAVQNLERLKTGEGGVSIAFVQGGVGNEEEEPGLETLGSVYYEPIWVFYRGAPIELDHALLGKRIAVGPPASGTRVVALRILHEVAADGAPTRLVDIGGLEAVQALQSGRVDVAFFIAGPSAPVIQSLLQARGVRLLSTQRAEAFARRLPFLHRLVLPAGAADLVHNVPRTDTALLGVTASLVATEDLHPVIAELMLEAAKKVHGGAGLFQNVGDFPSPRDLDYPLSANAERFYHGNPSVLRRYLPFWMVVWLNRFLIVAIPLLVLALPFLRFVPMVYQWRVRRRIYRWYGELRGIESDLRGGDVAREQLAERLDRLEARVRALHVPQAYSSEQYELTLYVRMMRDLMRDSPAGGAGR
ncbi:MAG: TAXI family TRAP transporter solute-binding subunit [Burkholderiales bacterium]